MSISEIDQMGRVDGLFPIARINKKAVRHALRCELLEERKGLNEVRVVCLRRFDLDRNEVATLLDNEVNFMILQVTVIKQ